MDESPLRAISDLWHEDAGFRAAVEEDAKAALTSKGLEIRGPAEVSVAVDTEDVAHIVFPPAPNEPLSDAVLARVSGGTGLHDYYISLARPASREHLARPQFGSIDDSG